MIDFSGMKKLTIGGVDLVKLFIDGVQVWAMKTFTNQIPISTDASGNVYNSKGFKENVLVSAGVEYNHTGKDTTGFIPCVVGNVIRLKNVAFNNEQNCRLNFYKADKTYIGQAAGNSTYILNTSFKGVKDADGYYTQFTITSRTETTNCAFIRITANDINDSSIVTINEEID